MNNTPRHSGVSCAVVGKEQKWRRNYNRQRRACDGRFDGEVRLLGNLRSKRTFSPVSALFLPVDEMNDQLAARGGVLLIPAVGWVISKQNLPGAR